MLSFLSCDTSAERLACVATASLAAGVFLSDTGTAIAVLGVLGSVLASRDLVALYLILTPISLLSDIIWLITGHPGKLAALLAIVLLFVKAAGIWFAYDTWSSTAGEAEEGGYQPFGTPSRVARDPFDRFAPPPPHVQPQQQYSPPAPAAAAAIGQHSAVTPPPHVQPGGQPVADDQQIL